MIKINLERELSDEFVGDVLVTAFDGAYGACWRWAKPAGRFTVESEGDVWTHVHFEPDEPVGDEKIDDIPFFTADAEMIRKGIQLILDNPEWNSYSLRNYILRGVLEEDAGDIDAICADWIIQLGAFGEEIFA